MESWVEGWLRWVMGRSGHGMGVWKCYKIEEVKSTNGGRERLKDMKGDNGNELHKK